MATKVVATATVRGIKRKLTASRVALTLVRYILCTKRIRNIKRRSHFYCFHFKQTPAAVNRVKQLLTSNPDAVSIFIKIHEIIKKSTVESLKSLFFR